MFKNNRLPAYTPSEAELEPPGYGTTLPVSFRVGTTDTPPVVSVEEVQAHLKILGAFSRLKTRVEIAQETVSENRLEPDAAWTVFLCRAVHRFEKWIHSRPVDGPAPLWSVVPVDVLMVWHSFMLNPLSYEGDGLRTVPQLQHLDTFPLLKVAALLSSDAFVPEPTDAARQAFEHATGTDFDPPLVTTANDSLEISCPACEKHTSFRWPWINDSVTGWAQRTFNCRCPTCDQYIDHEAYGVKRFADNVAKWCAHARTSTMPSFNPHKVESFDLAGATTSTQKTQINTFGRQIFKPLLESTDVQTGAELAKSWHFKFDKTETELLKSYATRPGYSQYDIILYRLRRILAHYRHPGPFSVELTSAVMRQGSFIQKMVDLGWTNPDRFTTDKTVVLRAIGRYHAFLDLMSSSPASFFVPTLDIDIAWHTHQLNARSYRADTLLMLGRTPNHDDKVEENKLSSAFDLTSQAWRRRFGVPYSVCGCAVPSDVPIPSTSGTPRTSRITRISRTIRGVTAFLPGTSHKRSASLPPQSSNTRPDLVTFVDDGAPDATHPSDHNAMIVMGSSRTATSRQQRQDRHSILLERRTRNVEAGTADPWTELQHRRAQREKEKHEAAFAYPIPYWGVSPYPYGYYGYGGAACGSGGGNAVPGDAAHGGATAGACSTIGCSSNGATGGSACGSACAAAGGSSGSGGGDGGAGGSSSSGGGGGDGGSSGGGGGGCGGGGCGGGCGGG